MVIKVMILQIHLCFIENYLAIYIKMAHRILKRALLMNIQKNNPTILAILFSLYIPIIAGFSLFLGHVFFLFYVFFMAASNNKPISLNIIKVGFLALSLLILSIITLFFVDMGIRYIQDTVKIFILVFSVIILSNYKTPNELLDVLIRMIMIFPFVLIFHVLFVHNGSLFTYSNRFYLPFFGSPNVLGSISCLCIIILIFFKNISVITKSFSLIIYFSIVILGLSRAAILSLVLSLFTSKKGQHLLLMLFVLISITITLSYLIDINIIPDWVLIKTGLTNSYNPATDDGRRVIWNATFLQIFDNTYSFLFGNNPGGTIIELGKERIVKHPHNTYLFVFWAYGIIGFMFFIVSIMTAIRKTFCAKDHRTLRISLLVFYLVVFYYGYTYAGRTISDFSYIHSVVSIQ